MKTPSEIDYAAWIEEVIRDFCATAANSLENGTGERAWGEPRVAFARGDDPLYAKLKADIGPFFWTPAEAFALAYPDTSLPAGHLTVISYILPQTEATRADQRRETEVPAERWARSRFFGEAFNCELRLHLAARLTAAGFPAVAPERLPGFAYRQSERYGLASNWSERHTAWIAGNGTFGLSDGLITELGKAVRFGSVVAAIDLAPTPSLYRPPGLVPLVRPRHLWRLHPPLPGRRHHRGRARQRSASTTSATSPPLRHRTLRYRRHPAGCAR
jgi:hypothetical protein